LARQGRRERLPLLKTQVASSYEQSLSGKAAEDVHGNEKNRPLMLSGVNWRHISHYLSPLPVAAKLPRPWEPPGHGGMRGSLAGGGALRAVRGTKISISPGYFTGGKKSDIRQFTI